MVNMKSFNSIQIRYAADGCVFVFFHSTILCSSLSFIGMADGTSVYFQTENVVEMTNIKSFHIMCYSGAEKVHFRWYNISCVANIPV